MPPLDRKVKDTCANCGTSVTKQKPSQHKSRCSARTLYCANYPNFSTKSRGDLNCHIAKKHATPRLKITNKCKISSREFFGFHALREHKKTKHGIQMKSGEFDVNNLLEGDDADLNEKFRACQLFLVDCELEEREYRVFNFTMSTADNSLFNKKLDLVLKGLECAVK